MNKRNEGFDRHDTDKLQENVKACPDAKEQETFKVDEELESAVNLR